MTKAVLLINLGSPRSTSLSDVRSYLGEFLMDPYVLDVNVLLRAFLVYGIILPKRPQKTKEAYEAVWTEQGSPLLAISENVTKRVQEKTTLPVRLAMRYSEPSIRKVTQQLIHDYPTLKHIFVVPLYPQYAMSTTTTVIEKVKQIVLKLKRELTLSFQPAFYNDPDYLNAVTSVAKPYITEQDTVLFSYHGLPIRHLSKTDPTKQHCGTKNCCTSPSSAWDTCYKYQCYETTRLVSQHLELPQERVVTSFQSRLGKDPWIEPYTDQTITQLAKSGVSSLKVICPSFVTDCLETLEEIAIGGKEIFLENGGKSFEMIPCLNESEIWIDTLVKWITRFQSND